MKTYPRTLGVVVILSFVFLGSALQELLERILKFPLIITPGPGGVQKNLEKPGFPHLPRR
jgi:hypothetical protein